MPAYRPGQDLRRRPGRPRGLPGHDEVARSPARADPGRSLHDPPLLPRSSWGRPSSSCGCRALRAQECLDCHGEPGSSVSFRSGAADVTIDRKAWEESVHGSMGVSCTDCHTGHQGVPAPRGERRTRPGPTRCGYYTSCQQCHEDQFKKTLDSVHQAPSPPATRRPPCAPTATTRTRRRRSPTTTASCCPRRGSRSRGPARPATARSTRSTARVSTGSALVHGNPDVPTCIDCHGVHDIPDPTHRPSSGSSLAAHVRRLPHRREAHGQVQALDAGAADLRGRLPRLDGDALPAPAPRPAHEQAGLLRLPRRPRHRAARTTRRRASR